MCAASENEQIRTSPSPRVLKSVPAPDRSHSPTAATPAAAHTVPGSRSRSTIAPSTGVSTTNSPVMKPALEAVVFSMPSVWKM